MASVLGSVDAIHRQGAIEMTGSTTDLAITGNGFFTVGTEEPRVYTRNGHFSLDSQGSLVDSNGLRLQGWHPDALGAFDESQPLQDLRIPLGESMAAQPTSAITWVGNLDASQEVYSAGPPAAGGQFTSEVTVYDSLGASYRLALTFEKATPPVGAASAWAWTTRLGTETLGSGTVAFDSDGRYDAANSTALPTFAYAPANGASPLNITPDFSAMTQLSTPGVTSVLAREQDGFPAGSLQSFSIGQDGVVTGTYTNGINRAVGQVALAYFTNPSGLESVVGGLLQESANSGTAQLGAAGTGPRGLLTPSALEMSNVDLATEFTRMILAQRAFQANSRVITTMDEILNEVSNLRR